MVRSCNKNEFGEGIAVRLIRWRMSATFALVWVSVVAVAVILPLGTSTSYAAGALAIGKCGVFGEAFDRPTQAAAVAAARKQCKGDCTVVTMRRACVALSIDMKNPCGSYGQAVAPRISSALNAATKFCYQYGGKECVIRAWACDARG
jgi:hypothetical protein